MRGEEAFWKRVQEILDQRGDPLADEEVQGFLVDHPHLLEETGSLREDLALIRRHGRGLSLSGNRRRAFPAWIVIAAAGLLACMLLPLWPPAKTPILKNTAGGLAAALKPWELKPGSPGWILDYRMQVRTAFGSEIKERTVTPEGASDFFRRKAGISFEGPGLVVVETRSKEQNLSRSE